MVSLLQPIRIFGVLYRSPFLRVGSDRLIVSAFPASVITTSNLFLLFYCSSEKIYTTLGGIALSSSNSLSGTVGLFSSKLEWRCWHPRPHGWSAGRRRLFTSFPEGLVAVLPTRPTT